jgi:hypothetical protein
MKDFYTLKKEMAAVAETYAEMNEAFVLTKSNYKKTKSLDKLMMELVKFAKKAGHKPFSVPPGDGFSKRNVSKPKGFYSPTLMELIQSLYYTSNDTEDDEWAGDLPDHKWSPKMAKMKVINKNIGLEILDPEDSRGIVAIIRGQIFIAMTDMFEANPEFMKQYGTPEQATQMFIK